MCARSSAYFSANSWRSSEVAGSTMLMPDRSMPWVDGELPDVGFAAQQREVADVAAVQDFRGAQDPHVRPLRQHDVPALRAGPAR